MRDEVISRFDRLFGHPTRRTQKVVAWEARPDAGVVVFLDIPSKGDYAKVCVPCPRGEIQIPVSAKRAHPERRHSNTFASPGLSHGAPALYFWVRDTNELDQLVAFIRELPPIRGVA